MEKSKFVSGQYPSYNPPLLPIISFIAIVYLAYYIGWRITATLNPGAPFFSWVLVLAEAFGALSYMLFSWMTQDIRPTRKFAPARQGIAVDVFIPTYNEDLHILEATMIGCNKITYPHITYVLDDGRRESVKALAERLGCSYLTRGSNEHAKAGNINAALAHTSGEFIVILDADMIPQPDFIDRTLGYFEDAGLAVIQTPQEFYNRDSVQHDSRAYQWHEQSLFFRVIQPGKNHSDSAFWCGSPSIVRRKALEDVGGVATDTITEDIHTSVRLHSRGWASLFVNEPLAYGIAPQTMRSFLLQRLRWAQGTMQLYRSKESPLWIKGLTIRQRLSYLASFLAYFESFQKLILILTPVFIISFNVFPMKVGMLPFLVRWVPYFAITVLANTVAGRGQFRYLQTEKFNILKMVVFIQSTVMLFQQRSLRFEVTPKSVDETVYKKERKSLRAYFVILGLISGAILYGLIRVRAWDTLTLDRQLYMIAMGWAAYNALLVYIAIVQVLSKPHDRKQYRFRIDLEGELFYNQFASPIASVRIRDLSISGVGFVGDTKLPADRNRLRLQFETPQHQRIVLPISNLHQLISTSGKTYFTGASFSEIGRQDRARLFEFLFVDVPGRRLPPVTENPDERFEPLPLAPSLPDSMSLRPQPSPEGAKPGLG